MYSQEYNQELLNKYRTALDIAKKENTQYIKDIENIIIRLEKGVIPTNLEKILADMIIDLSEEYRG